MFYQESYKSMWYETNPELIEQVDYILGTLVGDILNRITVTYIADRADIHYELSKQILMYYVEANILKIRYAVRCPKCDNVLFMCDEDELFDKIERKPICINCEDNDYELSQDNICIIFERLKKSTTSQDEVNETLKKHGDIADTIGLDFSFFNQADSLGVDEIYDMFYKLNESAAAELNEMYQNVLMDTYNTTKEKGDRLENLVERMFEYGVHFKTSKQYRTSTNQLDVTVLAPFKVIIPTVLDFLSPFFICECKNEKEKPSNTYYHKLASILSNTGEKGAKVGIVISRLPCTSKCQQIAHDKYLKDNIVLINLVQEDLKQVIDKKINLLNLIAIKINAIVLDCNQQLKDNKLL